MSRPQVTLRVEILTRQEVIEDTFEAPEGWETMTDREREAWCQESIDDRLGNYVSTTYEWTE